MINALTSAENIKSALDDMFFERQDAILLDIVQNDPDYKPHRDRLNKAENDLIKAIGGANNEIFREYEDASINEMGYCMLAIYKKAFLDGIVFALNQYPNQQSDQHRHQR